MTREGLQALLDQMTLEEKLGQLTQTTGEHFIEEIDEKMSHELVETGPAASDLGLTEETIYTIGSVLGVSSAKATNLIQKNYLQKSRLKIPLLFMHDAIHGYRTIFPIPLGLSCSWDKDLLEKVAGYTATELRASGIHVNFSPMADLVRDARWGRVMESFGEDHLLAGDLGKAMIKGYQKDEDGEIPSDGVAACLKHFAAYGAADAGRDYASVDMSMKEFFGYYAKPYEIALEAKPRFVMSSFNSFNGEPVTASKYLLEEILRKQFGFEDLVISDWGAVVELKNHGTSENDKEAAMEAMNAGVDIEMVSTTYLQHGKELVEECKELEEKIDEAVMKILKLKNDLGLFENPFIDESGEQGKLLMEETLAFAKEAAKESCVLLKNEKVLPFKKTVKKVLIVGAFAKTKELLGNWQCKGSFEDVTSLEEGIKQVLPHADIYAYEKLEECPETVLKDCDSIIATIGENWELSGEGHSSVNIELNQEDQQLVRKVKALGKPFACVAFAGRPLALESVIEDIPALLWCWYPGTRAGLAVAELIFGEGTPSGKLTMSFPRVNGQVPIRYNEYRSGRPANETSYSSRYQDCEVGPLFEFGHGLSYAAVDYKEMKISSDVIHEEDEVTVTITLQNNSDYDCKETIILFMEDPVSKNVRPVREMIGYERVTLQRGKEQKVTFKLTVDDFKYVNTQLEKTIEPGVINLYINNMEHPVFKLKYLGRKS